MESEIPPRLLRTDDSTPAAAFVLSCAERIAVARFQVVQLYSFAYSRNRFAIGVAGRVATESSGDEK